MLDGKHILISGIATPDSIAARTASRCHELGARLVLTAFPRDAAAARTVADEIDASIPLVALDLTDAEDVARVAAHIADDLGPLHGALHAVAFAPRAALTGPFASVDAEDVGLAFRTSTWTLAALARIVEHTAPPEGASLVGLDFDADGRAWPVYDWMGVCKTALGATARYLARDLGPRHIRVNLVAAGPLHTRAANAIPGFDRLLEAWDTTAPLPWDPTDPTPVADTISFLFSDLARAITGETIHVDGGFHAMAGPR